jgi:hypothetical protein
MISQLRRAFRVGRDVTRDFGAGKALQDLLIRGVNRAFYFRVLRCVVVTEPPPPDRGAPIPYEHGFADREQLLEWAADSAYELSPRFVEDALASGSRCYAIWDGPVLASYGWYSSLPTPVSADLWLHFDPRYVYMYKGFTDTRYRGQRLHALGMIAALRTCLSEGSLGLVSYVESNNFSSLRSCARMGYRDFGWIAFAKMFRGYLIRRSRGCREYAFELKHEPPSARVEDPAGFAKAAG